MADDLLDNETVQLIAGIGAAAGALAFGAVGPMDAGVLAKIGIRPLVFHSRDPRS